MQKKKIDNPKEKIVVEISNSLQEAFDILGAYQFEVPPCPVLVYETKMWYFTFSVNNRQLRKNTTFSLVIR